MSHFTVLVIDDPVEEQLQPFHEYECTGVKDEYVVWVDEHEEVEKAWKDTEDKSEYGNSIDTFADDYFGYEKGENGHFGRYTNPNATWDWWVVGGRWTGFFEVKEGCENAAELGNKSFMGAPADPGSADRLRLGAIDWDKMREKARSRAAEEYDNYDQNHPWNKALREAKIFIFRDAISHFECHNGGRETFIQNRINSVGVPYAFVKDSEWVGKGDMGWFGMSSNDLDENEWNKKFHEMLASLDPETIVTLVDCHI
jgi:hypothetical protein